MSLTFTVSGQPVPQPRARVSTRGGFARAYVPARHPIHAWRDAIAAAYRGPLHDGPLSVAVTFSFARPASHTGKRGLTVAGRLAAYPKSDTDNCLKALDALNGVAWLDDSQIVRLCGAKGWCHAGDLPGAEISITEVSL